MISGNPNPINIDRMPPKAMNIPAWIDWVISRDSGRTALLQPTSSAASVISFGVRSFICSEIFREDTKN